MIVEISDEFDLDKIVFSGQCFRPRKLADNRYFFVCADDYLFIEKINDNQYEVSCNADEWKSVWMGYFDLQTNYAEIRKQIDSSDDFMLKSGICGEGIRILRQNKWEMVISFIISQRKSIPAIRSAVEKLCRLYGKKMVEIDGECIYSFPSANDLAKATDEELASCGLGYRVAYIKDAVNRVNTGVLDLEEISNMRDEQLFEELKKIYGVGDKVANCILLFSYHRTGRAPVDTWIQKVMNEHYEGNNPFIKYGVNAGVIQQYVFYYVQNRKGL